MARTSAININVDAGTAASLAELYGFVVENYQKRSNVSRIKAQTPSTAQAGSYVFSRFQNAVVRTKGTARAAGEGDELIDDQVTVNVNTHKEIVEEFALFDVKAHGVGNLMGRRAPNHSLRMMADLDRAAWTAAKTAAAAASNDSNITWPNGTATASIDYLDLLEQTIQKVETVTNDYVDGVPRDMIVVALKPSIYAKVQSKLDTVFAYDGSTGIIEVPGYHGAMVVSEHYLPSGTDFIATTIGNIAQPVTSDGYTDGGRIPLDNNYEVSLFYDYGTTILANDLVFEGEYAEAAA